MNMIIYYRPFATMPSQDLLFIKLWAATVTLRMPEMEKAKTLPYQNDHI